MKIKYIIQMLSTIFAFDRQSKLRQNPASQWLHHFFDIFFFYISILTLNVFTLLLHGIAISMNLNGLSELTKPITGMLTYEASVTG
jgi:hypothetical protein